MNIPWRTYSLKLSVISGSCYCENGYFLQNVFLLVDALGKKECAGGILLTAKDYLPKRFGQAGQAGEVEQIEQNEQVEQICLTNT
jgi:hypothetical protein